MTIPTVHHAVENSAMKVYQDNAFRSPSSVIVQAEILDALRWSKDVVSGSGYTQWELAKITNQSQSTVAEILSVMKLPEAIREAFRYNSDLSRAAVLDVVRHYARSDTQAIHDALCERIANNAESAKTRSEPTQTFCKKINALAECADKLNFEHLNFKDAQAICKPLFRLLNKFAPYINAMDTCGPADDAAAIDSSVCDAQHSGVQSATAADTEPTIAGNLIN